MNYELFAADGEAPGERLIVYNISKEGGVTYVQTWEGDFVDKNPMLLSMLKLPLQTSAPNDMTLAARHWAYFEKCDALIANESAGQISLASAYAIIMKRD